MAKIGEISGFEKGSVGNVRRDIPNTPLHERVTVKRDGSLGYRVDITGGNPDSKEAHITAINIGKTK